MPKLAPAEHYFLATLSHHSTPLLEIECYLDCEVEQDGEVEVTVTQVWVDDTLIPLSDHPLWSPIAQEVARQAERDEEFCDRVRKREGYEFVGNPAGPYGRWEFHSI